jgi:predicted O-linked N-acetylglucosamine transferase (SPINDLY family)
VPQGAPCLNNGYITFGVFNHYHKITDEILEAWREIMAQVPDSCLLLKCQVLVSESACALVRQRLEKLGLDLERITLEPATNTYMNRYLDVDVALDTYPYPGGGTTCDALYMGVPVVSLYGDRRGSRFGLSILNNTGLGELAVSNINEYIERAVGLASDKELLDVLHKSLRRMMTAAPIMDGKKYMAELEKAYISILAGK